MDNNSWEKSDERSNKECVGINEAKHAGYRWSHQQKPNCGTGKTATKLSSHRIFAQGTHERRRSPALSPIQQKSHKNDARLKSISGPPMARQSLRFGARQSPPLA
ncbi:MAG: hypothetical protein Q7J54_06430, partial [Candidatus Woesearchaeota archaeon]|nr:hypothetical protein [Candidatus Woesearchaeota archaeon]